METVLKSKMLTVVIKHVGAELSSVKDNNGLEFIWQAEKKVWPRHAPVLFPIVGKLKDNLFNYEGKTYELGQHGFARDMIFMLVHKDESACSFKLQSSEETIKKFPFDFSFIISYILKDQTLITKYEIINDSNFVMPFSVGAHPGFNCPLTAAEQFEDYYIEFESSQLDITPLNNGLRRSEKNPLSLPHKKLPLTAMTFDNDALVFENRQINEISLKSNASSHVIEMKCEGWPYFGIWSKKGNKDFVCLEPWYGIADLENASGNLAQKDGSIKLQPAEQFNCSFSIRFS